MVSVSAADAPFPGPDLRAKARGKGSPNGENVSHPHERLNPYGQMPNVLARDMTKEPPPDFLSAVLVRLHESISDFTALIEDQSHRVDEYLPGTIAENVTTVQLQPQYEQYDEIIESVMVTGPATTAFTLQLGRRFWSTLLTNAQGFFLMTPVRMELGRNDLRILTAAAGAWTLELTGFADIRYRYK